MPGPTTDGVFPSGLLANPPHPAPPKCNYPGCILLEHDKDTAHKLGKVPQIVSVSVDPAPIQAMIARSEAVNHPHHYGGDTPYEAIKVINAWGLAFNLGNTVKYISRAGKKDPTKTLEDLRKAAFYLNYEINRLAGTNSESGTMGA